MTCRNICWVVTVGANTEVRVSAVGKGLASGVVVEVMTVTFGISAIGACRLVRTVSAGPKVERVAARALTCAICWVPAILHFARRDVPEVLTDAVVIPGILAFRAVYTRILVVGISARAGRVIWVLACGLEPARRRVCDVMALAGVITCVLACCSECTCLDAIQLGACADRIVRVVTAREELAGTRAAVANGAGCV